MTTNPMSDDTESTEYRTEVEGPDVESDAYDDGGASEVQHDHPAGLHPVGACFSCDLERPGREWPKAHPPADDTETQRVEELADVLVNFLSSTIDWNDGDGASVQQVAEAVVAAGYSRTAARAAGDDDDLRAEVGRWRTLFSTPEDGLRCIEERDRLRAAGVDLAVERAWFEGVADADAAWKSAMGMSMTGRESITNPYRIARSIPTEATK